MPGQAIINFIRIRLIRFRQDSRGLVSFIRSLRVGWCREILEQFLDLVVEGLAKVLLELASILGHQVRVRAVRGAALVDATWRSEFWTSWTDQINQSSRAEELLSCFLKGQGVLFDHWIPKWWEI